MNLNRRNFIQWSLTSTILAAAGCADSLKTSALPATPWPDATRPASTANPYQSPPPTAVASADVLKNVIPRSSWTRSPVILSRINPMNGISRITCHHEGAEGAPVTFTDISTTAARLETIRKIHIERMDAADIGYHFIIDRAGRIWEGRSLTYQGAHVKYNNEHNIGVMTLGNFDIQSPSEAQLTTLAAVVSALRHRYSVPVNRVYTHQELRPTSCPGRALQPKIEYMRSHNIFA